MLHRVKPWIAKALVAAPLLVPAGVDAQTEWPTPPDGWWEDVSAGSSASYEVSMTGMNMGMTQTVTAVDGTMLTVETVMSMMGADMPGSSTVVDAETLTPEASLEMLSAAGGGTQSASQMADNYAAMVEVEGEEDCSVGDVILTCTIYVAETPGGTLKTWHSPAIPPVFSGGAVKAEITANGMSYSMVMTAFEGDLIDN
ncbi:MAG: hypothetical protein MJB57_03405 [Gemmatimonadetes bacterium]|nr:hypothetical protein [Gemmatimonadota bacterium]